MIARAKKIPLAASRELAEVSERSALAAATAVAEN